MVGWHGVSRSDEHIHFPSLYISKDEFHNRLRFLTNKYQIVSLETAVRQLKDGVVFPNQVVLTFDDGNYDFYAEAAPILESYNATATNYVVTHFSESGEPVWNMLARYIVSSGLSSLSGRELTSRRRLEEQHALAELSGCNTMSERSSFIDTLAARYRIDLAPIFEKRIMHAMNPAEIKELDERGFDLQIHTHEHKNVVANKEDMVRQIETCREWLQKWLEKPINHFCYPSGRWDHEAVGILDELSIESAVTIRPGPNLVTTNPCSLRRVLNGEENSQVEFEFEMSNLRWLTKSIFDSSNRHNPEPQSLSYMEERGR